LRRCFQATTAQSGHSGRVGQLDARVAFDAGKIELEREPGLDGGEQGLLRRKRRLSVGRLRCQLLSIDRRYGGNRKRSNAHDCLDHLAHRASEERWHKGIGARARR
jgi:hypothetical protein